MIQVSAPITGTRRVSPGTALLHLQAPEIASRARPGQFVLVRCSDGLDPYLRRPFPLFAIRRRSLRILVRADEPGRRWLAHQPVGQAVDLLGPLGQGFTLAPYHAPSPAGGRGHGHRRSGCAGCPGRRKASP